MSDGMPQPVGRPQGGAKSEAGRAAYWRLQYESAIGALADLIAEHTETVKAQEALIAEARADEREQIAQAIETAPVPDFTNHAHLIWRDEAAQIARNGGSDE